jgi:hypothetical protein
MTDTRKIYSGSRRILVLAFDVGTTFSGVSYAFLDPGDVPKIHGVTRSVFCSFHARENIHSGTDSLAKSTLPAAQRSPPSCTMMKKARCRPQARRQTRPP